MRIAYFTSHVYGPDFVSAPLLGKRPNPAGQNFHEKVIKALARFATVDVYSYVPLSLDLPEKDFEVESVHYHYVKTSGNKFARAFAGPSKLARRATEDKYDAVFFDSLNRSAAKAALMVASRKNAPSIAILTDHPKNITGLSDAYIKSLLLLSGKASASFALTQDLVEGFGLAERPHLVQSIIIEKESVKPYAHPRPYIYYGGALFVKDGLSDLVGAYLDLQPDYDLLLAGHGPYEKEIEKIVKDHPSIVFLGQVSKADHLALSAGSSLAINPRRYNKSLDDYAVPSKVMEYLCYAPYVASTKTSGISNAFPSDVNWITGDLKAFLQSHLDGDGKFVSLIENAAKDRIESLFGIGKTSANLQEFLTNLTA